MNITRLHHIGLPACEQVFVTAQGQVIKAQYNPIRYRETDCGKLFDQGKQNQPLFPLELVYDNGRHQPLSWGLYKAERRGPYRIRMEVENIDQTSVILGLLGFKPTEKPALFTHQNPSTPEIFLAKGRETQWHVGLEFNRREIVRQFIEELPETSATTALGSALSQGLRKKQCQSGFFEASIAGLKVEIGYGPRGFVSHGFLPDPGAETAESARARFHQSGKKQAAIW